VGREYGGYFVDMGTPESLSTARGQLPAWRDKSAVLLDRDGVINVDKGHVHTPDEFEWVTDAPAAIKWLNDRGFLVFVVTNQAGIAKGYYTETEYRAFERWISDRLAEYGAHIDQSYYCPHHPEGSGVYRRQCDCRKPAPGLLMQLKSDWRLDPNRAIFIGDKQSDLEAADKAGIRGILFHHSDSLLDTVKTHSLRLPQNF
jgi:D,D-heptose 1,7-bisphosphate phosphatase